MYYGILTKFVHEFMILLMSSGFGHTLSLYTTSLFSFVLNSARHFILCKITNLNWSSILNILEKCTHSY